MPQRECAVREDEYFSKDVIEMMISPKKIAFDGTRTTRKGIFDCFHEPSHPSMMPFLYS
jgi:hypothetical protein